ncbi:hypothetical protein RKD05_002858 [Microbacterium sp. SLBN-111]
MRSPAQKGLDADSAWRWGRNTVSAFTMGMTLSTSSTPTCTWMPQIIMLRPHHWVRSMSLWYRVLSVTCWSYHCANGWLPAHSNSMPRGSVCSRSAPMASAMSSTDSATV